MLTTWLYVPAALVVGVVFGVTASTGRDLHIPAILLAVLGGTLYLHFGVGTPAARWWAMGIAWPVAIAPFTLVIGMLLTVAYHAVTGEPMRWN